MTSQKGNGLKGWAFGIASLVLLYSCDRLDQDAIPDRGGVKAERTQVFALANSSATINLRSLVKTQLPVQIKVVSLPARGELIELETGVLQYVPNVGFTEGTDSFRYDVVSLDNPVVVLAEDSVIITVSDDEETLPCGLYAVTDSATAVGARTVSIDVTANDILCDSAGFCLKLYQPLGDNAPYGGGVTLTENMIIQYTPAGVFSGEDHFFYKIASVSDSTRYSIGRVNVTVQDPFFVPDFDVFANTYTFKRDSLKSDTLWLPIFGNDNLPAGEYTSSIFEQPQHGDAMIHGVTSLEYWFYDSPGAFTDSLTYQVCRDSHCKTAKVYVTLQ